QVDASRVDVERIAKVALAHRGALDVPTRTTPPERRVPRGADLLIARLRLLPEREVADVLLVVLVARHPRSGLEPSTVEVREGAVGWEARDSVVNVAVGDVRVPVGDQRGDHLDHLGNVLGRPRVLLGALRPKGGHVFEEG